MSLDLVKYKTSFFDAAETLLEIINQVYADANETLPERQFITAGRNDQESVHDCEQVAVIIEGGYDGTPAQRLQAPSRCNDPRTGTYTVEIVRCQTTPKSGRGGTGITDPAELTDDARKQAIDMYLLQEAGLLLGEAEILDRIDAPGSLTVVSVGREQGGYQAVVLEVSTVI